MHEYQRRIDLAAKNGLFKPGTVVPVFVYHDNWCRIHHKQECNCDPNIILDCAGEKLRINSNGDKILN